jgi:Tol biopolymer transport system component
LTGTPIYTCKEYSRTNVNCHTPRLSPNEQLVAFGTVGGGGHVCFDKTTEIYWADYVNVRDRSGAEVAKFEGYAYPEWLPDGRLLMLGSLCRNAGVWVTDAALKRLTRIDGNQIGTPAALPAVSPDGKRVALVLNKQLWVMTLDARHELTQVTEGPYSIGAAAWSPDGSALAVTLWDVSLPLQAVKLFRPGDERSVVVKQLPFYPYGPLSWH